MIWRSSRTCDCDLLFWCAQVLASVLQHNGSKYLFRDAAAKGMLPGIVMNPAVIPLPEGGDAASWHPDAYYVSVARHTYNRQSWCEEMTEGNLGAGFEWTGLVLSARSRECTAVAITACGCDILPSDRSR